ncbi:MAG: hypothetical protein WC637_13060 [Victivallales bacterium]|jgi:hypothetical protein
MINPFIEINWKPDSNDLRKFGRSVLGGFLIISAVFLLANTLVYKYPFAKAAYIPLILSVSGIAVCFISYFIKPLALPVYYAWFVIGASMGIVVSNLLLSLFYYLIFTPVGLAIKYLTGRDPLNLKGIKTRKSNWNSHNANRPLRRYFKQY